MKENYVQNYQFESENPIGIIPWESDFLHELELLLQQFSSKQSKENIILVFPNGRPRRYLESRYKDMAKKLAKSQILPHIMTGDSFLTECLMHYERGKTPYQELSRLDRISYLHDALINVAKTLPESDVLRRLLDECKKPTENISFTSDRLKRNHKEEKLENSNEYSEECRNTVKNQSSIEKQNATETALEQEEKSRSMERFFPWALSLDALFEECFSQLVDVIDIKYAQDDVAVFASALLGELHAIHKEYIALLQDESKPYRASTPAFSAFRAAQFIQAYERYLQDDTSILQAPEVVMEADSARGMSVDALHNRATNIASHFLVTKNMTKEECQTLFDDFMPDMFKDKLIIFAGFVRLTKAEDVLFKHFWQRGACVLFHTDANILTMNTEAKNTETNNVHYSCFDHVEWVKRWSASLTFLAKKKTKDKEELPKIHFFAAYDAHSQVEAFQGDLFALLAGTPHSDLSFFWGNNSKGNNSQANNSSFQASFGEEFEGQSLSSGKPPLADDALAVLLPKPSLLMPILHQLPEKDINISMGYPIVRTLFGQFIDLVLRIQENQKACVGQIFSDVMKEKESKKDIEGIKQAEKEKKLEEETLLDATKSNEISYVWSDMVTLLRHPYTRMLLPYEVLDEIDIVQGVQANERVEKDNSNTTSLDLQSEILAEKSVELSLEKSVEEQEEKEKNAQTLWRSVLYYLENSLLKGNFTVQLSEFLSDNLGNIDETPHGRSLGLKEHDLSQENVELLNTFIDTFFDHCVHGFENISCLQDIAHALEKLILFLLQHGSKLWQNFPLDAESLVLCMERIIPALRDNGISQNYLPKESVFVVVRDLLAQERIPFEADPLSGMQILGMLESRLLRFKNIFLLDMTEENMPGVSAEDPLMPNSIRNLLSLPDAHKRELLVAHTFYRLIAGAENVWLYWQEGVQASQIQSGKSLRSRFVEECLWKKEQKIGKILEDDGEIVRRAPCKPVAPLRKPKQSIVITKSIQTRLVQFFEKPLSASALNMYLQCPVKFYYSYIARLSEVEEVNEGDDYRELGVWLHKILQETYKDFIEKPFEHCEASFEGLIKRFYEELNSPEVAKFASPESYFMLKLAGAHHFKNYWKSMPRFIKPLALEETYECDLPYEMYENNPLNIQKIRLQGKFDRVDIRCSGARSSAEPLNEKEYPTENLNHNLQNIDWENAHWIIDYKTGKKLSVKEGVWENHSLWERIYAINALVREKARTANNLDSIQEEIELHIKQDGLLNEIAESIHTVQLPFYLYVYGLCVPHVRCNAAWIFLAEEKQEVPLITLKEAKNENKTNKKITGKKATEEVKICHESNLQEDNVNMQADQNKSDIGEKYADSWQLLDCIKNNRMPQLLTFLINHLLHASSFKHCEGKACLYCPHKEYC